MSGGSAPEVGGSDFAEVDPSGRYGRYNEILGKGACKTVYKAFDEYQGIEVAWNQVKLHDFLQSPQELERLYCEIHLLKTLRHPNIMKFYTSWVDTSNRNINFVTEMFTSGTLRQYSLKHRRVNIRALKHWCRQILSGLLYLHSHDPPVIHRDLKCDNIFINGNQGEVKIGDLGLAAVLRKSRASCVGTPEFMAPEIYEEEYNELVDIYSFGMCILEMVTFDYPYSECTHPAQIYKKVISGKMPEALYKVQDPEVQAFVEKCLATASLRLPASELLKDSFLQIDDYGFDTRTIQYQSDYNALGPLVRQPFHGNHFRNNDFLSNGYNSQISYSDGDNRDFQSLDVRRSEIDLFDSQDDGQLEDVDITIKGKWREDDGIFLRLRIADKEGRIRNIYFPFDTENDTAVSVASEMVAELDITDQDVTKIADMINGEIASLVPGWRRALHIDESSQCTNLNYCENCASVSYPFDYRSSSTPAARSLQVLQCSRHGCTAVHGRFEEVTYQVEQPDQCDREGEQVSLRQPAAIHHADIWAQRDGPEPCSEESSDILRNQASEASDTSISEVERSIDMNGPCKSTSRDTSSVGNSLKTDSSDDYENEIRRELRWLKAKYQMQLRDLKNQKLQVKSGPSSLLAFRDLELDKDDKASITRVSSEFMEESNVLHLESSTSMRNYAPYPPLSTDGKCGNLASQGVQNAEAITGSCSPEAMITAKNIYLANLLPHPLHRASSLPVDAVDV